MTVMTERLDPKTTLIALTRNLEKTQTPLAESLIDRVAERLAEIVNQLTIELEDNPLEELDLSIGTVSRKPDTAEEQVALIVAAAFTADSQPVMKKVRGGMTHLYYETLFEGVYLHVVSGSRLNLPTSTVYSLVGQDPRQTQAA